MICRFFKVYVAIGLVVGSHAWLTDATSDAGTLIGVPIIATIWPLWVYLLMVAG